MKHTVRELLADGAKRLVGSSPSPALDARVLLAFALGWEPLRLVTDGGEPASAEGEARYQQLLDARRRCVPVAYLVGEKEFCGISFAVGPGVLVPRPETELLVERGVQLLKDRPEPRRVLDLATGSGCVAVALAAISRACGRSAEVIAIEVSPEALSFAEQNVSRAEREKNIIAGSVRVLRSDWFEELSAAERFALITCNPPYVAEKAKPALSADLAHEPPGALFAGADGLDAYRKIFAGLPSRMLPGGVFLGEIGADQGETIVALARQSLGDRVRVQVRKDLAGLDRLVEITFPNAES